MSAPAEFVLLMSQLNACASRMRSDADRLATENVKLVRQLDDALDGIAELKQKVRELEQLNEELRTRRAG